LPPCFALKLKREQLGLKREQLGLKREQFGLKREQFGLKRQQFGLKREQFGLKREQLRLKREQFRLTREQFRLTREQLRLTREQLRLKREQFGLKREQFGLKREQFTAIFIYIHHTPHPTPNTQHPTACLGRCHRDCDRLRHRGRCSHCLPPCQSQRPRSQPGSHDGRHGTTLCPQTQTQAQAGAARDDGVNSRFLWQSREKPGFKSQEDILAFEP
jgi:hypothetical protein